MLKAERRKASLRSVGRRRIWRADHMRSRPRYTRCRDTDRHFHALDRPRNQGEAHSRNITSPNLAAALRFHLRASLYILAKFGSQKIVCRRTFGSPKAAPFGVSLPPGTRPSALPSSLLEHIGHKLKQRLRRSVLRQAEVFVEAAVIGLFGSEYFRGNAGVFQDVAETLRLRRRVGMIGDVEDEERRGGPCLGHRRGGGGSGGACPV